MNTEAIQPCQTYGIIQRQYGVALRDVMVHIEGRKFSVTVATPSYIMELRERNASLPHAIQGESNILPLPTLDDEQLVCRRLHALPMEVLQPYLTEQVEK